MSEGKNKQSLGDLWAYNKRVEIFLIGVLEDKRKKVGLESIQRKKWLKIFCVAKDINLQIEEVE